MSTGQRRASTEEQGPWSRRTPSCWFPLKFLRLGSYIKASSAEFRMWAIMHRWRRPTRYHRLKLFKAFKVNTSSLYWPWKQTGSQWNWHLIEGNTSNELSSASPCKHSGRWLISRLKLPNSLERHLLLKCIKQFNSDITKIFDYSLFSKRGHSRLTDLSWEKYTPEYSYYLDTQQHAQKCELAFLRGKNHTMQIEHLFSAAFIPYSQKFWISFQFVNPLAQNPGTC